MLADTRRKKSSSQHSHLGLLEEFISKKEEKIASLQADLKDSVKQLDRMLARKDTKIAALEASCRNETAWVFGPSFRQLDGQAT